MVVDRVVYTINLRPYDPWFVPCAVLEERLRNRAEPGKTQISAKPPWFANPNPVLHSEHDIFGPKFPPSVAVELIDTWNLGNPNHWS